MKFCTKCGKEIVDDAVICVNCGCKAENEDTSDNSFSDKSGSKAPIVLGILGIVFAWLFALAGHVCSIIAIVTGVKSYKESGKMTGLVLGIVGEVCAIISSIIGAAMLS